MTARAAKYVLLTCIVTGVMILDQWTKATVAQRMELHESIPVIDHLFNLTYVRNPGAAFGFLADRGSHLRFVFFAVTSTVALALLFYFFVTSRTGDRIAQAGFALVLGGAVGNLFDRMRFGAVVDFLDFYLGQYHWPAFNIADSAITVGIGLLILHGFKGRGPACRPPAGRAGSGGSSGDVARETSSAG